MVCKLALSMQWDIQYLIDRIYPTMYKVVCEMEDGTQYDVRIQTQSRHL